jgi:hypothetical protein
LALGAFSRARAIPHAGEEKGRQILDSFGQRMTIAPPTIADQQAQGVAELARA